MSNLMKIGELAKQTGLSIRTLHYYDEIGLLCPSHRTEVGYRLYSNQDIIRLQQIVSLRQLGFSLREIQECLKNPEFSFQQTIDLHRARVKEQMALSRTLLKRLDVISTDLQTTKSVAVENLIQVMETISMSKQQYFTPEQQQVVDTRFRQVEVEWQDLLTQIRNEMNKGTDLNSPRVQSLAWSWRYFMQSFICGDWQIYESVVKAYQQEGAEVASFGVMDAATFEYMLKAVSFLSLAEDLDLVISFQHFTLEANQVIRLGQNAVIKLNFNMFDTEGILLGLLAEGTGVAARVLTAAGVNFETVQHEIMQLRDEWLQWNAKFGSAVNSDPSSYNIDPPPFSESFIHSINQTPAVPSLRQIPFAFSAKRVLEFALEEAKQLGQARIDSGHLLLGILKEQKERYGWSESPFGLVGYLLKERFGIDLANLEEQLRLAMSE